MIEAQFRRPADRMISPASAPEQDDRASFAESAKHVQSAGPHDVPVSESTRQPSTSNAQTRRAVAICMDKEYPLSMREAVIVEAVRSPIGKRNGGLSGVHAVDLSALLLNELVTRAALTRVTSMTSSGAA